MYIFVLCSVYIGSSLTSTSTISKLKMRYIDGMFQYTKLQSEREIRLLTVYHDGDGHLLGELDATALDEAGDFLAISYTWGEEKETHELSIDGRELHISRNAHEILHHFASSGKRMFLWIDTVCVDQNDEKDKTQQVRLMREIFNKANRVVIWLGSPNARPAQDMVSEPS